MKIIEKNEGEIIEIIPEGVSKVINGTMYSCSISELIKCLEHIKNEKGDVKIGIYDGFGQYSLMADTEENINILMSCYN